MKKEKTIHLRCSAEERNQIEQKANKTSMGISSYLIQSALSGKGRTGISKKQLVSYAIQIQKEFNTIDFYQKLGASEKEIRDMVVNIEKNQEELLWLLLK